MNAALPGKLSAFKKPAKIFFLSLFFVFVPVLLFYLADSTHFTDSEIWGISGSKWFPLDTARGSFFFKPFFHGLLKLPFLFDLNSLETILFARYQFAAIGAVVVWLTYQVARRVSQSSFVALGATFLLVTSTLFISRGFRIRSDLLCAGFFYLCLYLSFAKSDHEQKKHSSWLLGATLFLMFLSTPTSILLWPILLVRPINEIWVQKNSDPYVKKVFDATILVPTLLIFVASVFVILLPSSVKSFDGLVNYLEGSFSGPHSHYLDLTDFFHIRMFIHRDSIFFAAILISLAGNFFLSRKSPRQRQWYWITWLSLITVVFFPNKRPFFLYTYLPIFCIAVALLVYGFSQSPFVRKSKISLLSFYLALILLGTGLLYGAQKHFHLIQKNNLNAEQRILITEIENFFQAHQVNNYYDGFGVLPRYKFVSGFIGLGQWTANFYNIKRAKEEKPEIILYTGKLAIVRDHIIPFLLEGYTPLGHNVWARALIVRQNDKAFESVTIGEKNYWRLTKEDLLPLFPTEEKQLWTHISATYFTEQFPGFKDIILEGPEGGSTKPFIGDIELSELKALLIPQGANHIKLSRFPLTRLKTENDFNSGFLFDLLY